MARFGRSFVQAATQPAFTQGLFTAAQQVAGMPRRRREEAEAERKRKEEEAKLARQRQYQAGLLTLGASGEFDPEMLQGALGGAAELGIDPSRAAAAIQAGKGFRPQTVSRAEYFSQNPDEEAELYKNFKAESVQDYINGTGTLQPITDKEDKPKLSQHAQRLIEQGFAIGSPEFKQGMAEYNQSLVSGRAKGMSYKGPLEQTSFLNEELRSHPLYESTVNITEKVNKAESLKEGVNAGDSEAIRLMERTVSELYNSDSRAASEIDRLLQGRGISERFSNWVVTSLTGDVTQKTKDTLFAIVETSKKLAKNQQAMAVKYVSDSYSEYVSEEVSSNWVNKNKDAAVIEALTEEDAIGLYLNQ